MKTRDPLRRGKGAQSAAQRQGSLAMVQVMKAWEALSDPQRERWRCEGKQRRTTGINYFKHINLRRARRQQELAEVPPRAQPCDARPVLQGLDIRNPGGRITLMLQLRRVPAVPVTVWGALPCNRGLAKPDKCPRLGWLPPPVEGRSDITALYFQKHGQRIKALGLALVGKRIFIRTRQEVDGMAWAFEQVRALVPEVEGRGLKKA